MKPSDTNGTNVDYLDRVISRRPPPLSDPAGTVLVVMAGREQTRLVLLRGTSASGKSPVAAAVREKAGRNCPSAARRGEAGRLLTDAQSHGFARGSAGSEVSCSRFASWVATDA
ncbi:hypothetical protein DSC45_34205 [Streptomyces sp. YIM 130001]|nr:hypothetical protein DSC45_34205 [Streptomyces sp. YIM 130001]